MDKIKQQAIEYLVKVGALIRVEDSEIYHGRAGNGKHWEVDPNFNNAGDNTGNQNVGAISMLYASSKGVAQEFAQARALGGLNGKVEEVHKIESYDPESLILNPSYNFSLDPYAIAHLKTLSNFRITKYLPMTFEKRYQTNLATNFISKYLYANKISIPTVEQSKTMYEIYCLQNPFDALDADTFLKYVSALNTRKLLNSGKIDVLMNAFFENRNYILMDSSRKMQIPISLEYISAWLSDAKIIGSDITVWSATIGRKIKCYALFNLDKINTDKVVGQRLQQIINEYGELTNALSGFCTNQKLMQCLSMDQPEKIIDQLLKDDSPFAEYLMKSSTVWEGFTIGEHTETVLRDFETNFSHRVPDELKPFIRFLILMHDIDKYDEKTAIKDGVSSEDILDIKKDIYKNIMNQCGINPNMQRLIFNVCTNSQKYTSDYYVNSNAEALEGLNKFCGNILYICGLTSSSKDINMLQNGLSKVCRILQNCDSFAYTRMAVTRDHETGEYYYNANDRFTASFNKSTGLFWKDGMDLN